MVYAWTFRQWESHLFLSLELLLQFCILGTLAIWIVMLVRVVALLELGYRHFNCQRLVVM